MFSWITNMFRKPGAVPIDSAPPPSKVWTASDVIADDPYTAAVVAAAMNAGGMVFGEVDARGNLTISDEHGRPLSSK